MEARRSVFDAWGVLLLLLPSVAPDSIPSSSTALSPLANVSSDMLCMALLSAIGGRGEERSNEQGGWERSDEWKIVSYVKRWYNTLLSLRSSLGSLVLSHLGFEGPRSCQRFRSLESTICTGRTGTLRRL